MDAGTKPSEKMAMTMAELNDVADPFKDFVIAAAMKLLAPFMNMDMDSLEYLIKQRSLDQRISSAICQVYGKYYTADDVLDIIAFLKSPAGQKVIKTEQLARQSLISMGGDVASGIAVEIIAEAESNS